MIISLKRWAIFPPSNYYVVHEGDSLAHVVGVPVRGGGVVEGGGQQPVYHHVSIPSDRRREVSVERHAERVVPLLVLVSSLRAEVTSALNKNKTPQNMCKLFFEKFCAIFFLARINANNVDNRY